jgi:hypothetical protein
MTSLTVWVVYLGGVLLLLYACRCGDALDAKQPAAVRHGCTTLHVCETKFRGIIRVVMSTGRTLCGLEGEITSDPDIHIH